LIIHFLPVLSAAAVRPAIAHEFFDCIAAKVYCNVRYGYRINAAPSKNNGRAWEIGMAEVAPRIAAQSNALHAGQRSTNWGRCPEDTNDNSNPLGDRMIYVSKEVRANGDADQPWLSRSEIWKGLVMKAENALPFVPGMAKCDVVERTTDGLVRDIVFRGEDAREKITFYPEEKVVFLRLSGNVDGFIVNEILGDDNDLRLRFSFALQLVDAPSDSTEERDFRALMEREYLRAVDATLAAIRKMVSEPQPAA
jgi:hypothetical protein